MQLYNVKFAFQVNFKTKKRVSCEGEVAILFSEFGLRHTAYILILNLLHLNLQEIPSSAKILLD
jgi:hypothetical protein